MPSHILVADVGGTHCNVGIMAHDGAGKFRTVFKRTYRSQEVGEFPLFLRNVLQREGRALRPRVRQACIDFAGPIDKKRSRAFITNQGWGFTAAQIFESTDIDELTLLNDFEAVGYGIEVLLENRPDAFVRLSSGGQLPRLRGRKPVAVVIGAGTGLGTCILIQDPVTGRYQPAPGEGGHRDFAAADETEFKIAEWIRKNVNRSPANPVDWERFVSGPGLVNILRALHALEPPSGGMGVLDPVLSLEPYDRPGKIVKEAVRDPLCRKALDIWLRSYARAAKNSAIFPLAPGGVFLAGGIAAKILPEMQAGLFMKEFLRCDVPGIRAILRRTPVFVITDYDISLFGCANAAVHFHGVLGHVRNRSSHGNQTA